MKLLDSAIIGFAILLGGCSIDAKISQNNPDGIVPSKTFATKTLTVAEFNQLQASSTINVVYEQSNNKSYSATLSAPENLIPYVTFTQNGNKIEFGIKEVSINGNVNITIKVTSPELTNVGLSGACNFNSTSISQPDASLTLIASGASNFTINNLAVNSLNAQLSGASDLKISTAKAGDVYINASGASNAIISGTTQTAVLNASGASDIKAGKLQATSGSVTASGASDIKANIKNVTTQSSSGTSTIKL